MIDYQPIVCILYYMERLQMFIPRPLLNALKALSKKTDVSVSEHIRRAITEYLERKDRK